MTDDRPTWDDYYNLLAATAAIRGDCRRSRVGAILVASDHTVLGLGYNGTTPGAPGCLSGACPRGLLTYDELPAESDYAASGCIGIHAEDNCLRNSPDNAGEFSPTMYISRSPCDGCLRLMVAAGVIRVVYPGGEIDLLD